MAASLPRLVFGICWKRGQLLAGGGRGAGDSGGIKPGFFSRSVRGFARQPVERRRNHLFLRGNREAPRTAEFARAALSQAGRSPKGFCCARVPARQSGFESTQKR